MSSTGVSPRVRVVLGAHGAEADDRGAGIVARALRDAGHEVVYTGLHQTPEQIVETAIQEDADLIGLSVPGGAHLTQSRRIVELLAERDASDITVKVFEAGAPTSEITGWVAQHFA